ncbi:MAG: Dabb family protein [Muribaculaceae bacterium]|nr:Dabb family protein [Muribaculaceae bacterium]
MVKHIVLFKVKEFENPEEKRQVLEQFRDALMALPPKIPCLISIEAQINENPAESFDLALTTVFNNFEDLATYAAHPDHVAAAAIFKAVAAGRACVDYTF